MNVSLIEEDWQILLKMFPANWRELAKETKAITRTFRSFANEESVMRTLLLHIAKGYSLRETVTRAKLANIAEVSDVALLKRLQCSDDWFKELCLCLLKERGVTTVNDNKTIRMRLVDGTTVKEPGKTGSVWRIHYSLRLPDLYCDYFKLTGTEGKGSGESFKQFPIKKGDCIVGDRGYSTPQGIAYLYHQGAYILVRVNTQALNFFTVNKSKFNLLKNVKNIKQEHAIREWKVKLAVEDEWISGRLCIIRKSKIAAEQTIKKLKIKASKKQKELKPETLEFAKYVIVFTTLPCEDFPAKAVLKWYRLRWQIELVFKRLKSLAGLGHLPKYDEMSVKAWLYGKLFVGLLVEKLIHYAKIYSPWGYAL